MTPFVLSIIGTDRAGLVDALSEVVVEHGGSWERSQLSELAGVFAGVALVHLPEERADEFEAALDGLSDRLDITLWPAEPGASALDDAPEMAFEVVGADRPGIVHEVSHVLAELGVGIVDLETWTESAAMAAEPLFRAFGVVRLPDDVSEADVATALEGLSDDLMVDVADD